MKKNYKIFKIFFQKNIQEIFQEYFKNISLETITKAIKKQVGVACVIPFAPYGESFFF
jgi:hypothetical protein